MKFQAFLYEIFFINQMKFCIHFTNEIPIHVLNEINNQINAIYCENAYEIPNNFLNDIIIQN